MKSMMVWFEIPVIDFTRAKKFYNELMQCEIEEMMMGDTLMGFFRGDGFTNSGAIAKGNDYKPGVDGVLVYLHGGDDLQTALNRVEPAGGKIILPKTLVTEEIGFIALFLDTEGNRIGLWSQT